MLFIAFLLCCPFLELHGAPVSPTKNKERALMHCRKPQGRLGEIFITGCSVQTCSRQGRKAVWIRSFARGLCCSYERTGYAIGENISTSLADDLCSIVTLHCAAGQGGAPLIKITVDDRSCQPAPWQSNITTILEELTAQIEFCQLNTNPAKNESSEAWKTSQGWDLAMNINPSDGHNFGYAASAWRSGQAVGTSSEAFKGDFLNTQNYRKKANFIAIARHDGNNLEAVKVWKFKTSNKSLEEYFVTTNPGREIVTEDGHIQFSQVRNLKITSTKGNWDPIFGVGGNLVFNWWYGNNGVRICLDGGYLADADVNDDGTQGIGMELQGDTVNGNGGTRWWYDAGYVQGKCNFDPFDPCEVQGTDHGTSIASGGLKLKLGNYAIFVSNNNDTFPWNENC